MDQKQKTSFFWPKREVPFLLIIKKSKTSIRPKKKSFGSDPSRASPQGGQNKNVGRADKLIV